jgi:aspartate/methionine/tyrosine aminotransferase
MFFVILELANRILILHSTLKKQQKKAIDAGYTKYTPVGGAKDLCEAICKKFERDNSLHFLPEHSKTHAMTG